MFSSSCRVAGIIIPLKELQIFCFFEKAGDILLPTAELLHSSSCGRAAAILLPMEGQQVSSFLWKSCGYSSFYVRSAGNLRRVEYLLLFFNLWKVSRKFSTSCGRAAGIFLPMEEEQVLFFLYESCM